MSNKEQYFASNESNYKNKEEELADIDAENSEYIANMFLGLEHQGGNIEKREFLKKQNGIHENNNLPNLDDYESNRSKEN